MNISVPYFVFWGFPVASSVRSDNSMMSNRKNHKTSFSTKTVLPKIDHKKAEVTPRVYNTVKNHQVNSNTTPLQSTSAAYSPSAYADDKHHMTSHDPQDSGDSVDGDTQLAIDVLHSQSDSSILYHYSSRPHSAHKKSPNTK